MPKWSSDTDTTFLQTLERGPDLSKELPKVGSVFEKTKLGAGLADKIKEAAERASARQKSSSNTLQVDELGIGAGLRAVGGDLQLTEDALARARSCIKQEKYKEALKILSDVLKQRADHSAALYLKGLCQLKMDEAEPALNTIAPLIRSVPPSLDSQVRQLRADISKKMLPQVSSQVLELCVVGKQEAALSRIQQLLNLDAAVPVYHFLRIHILLMSGQLVQANAAVDEATPYCQGADQEMLKIFRESVRHGMLAKALEPARREYRMNNWRKCRKELMGIQPQWGHEPLWKVFYNYLETLGGGLVLSGKRPADVRPAGDRVEVDRLHFMLVREELGQAKSFLDQARPFEARKVLGSAHALTPFFPYLHYMLAQAIYLSVLVATTSRNPPELADVERLLNEAMQFAKSGASDPEIKAAPELISAIHTAQKVVNAVHEAIKKQENDIKRLRPYGDQFVAVMNSAKDGIKSVQQFNDVRNRLQTIRREIAPLDRQMLTEGGHQAVRQLAEAVDRNLKQLDDMAPEMEEAELVNRLAASFQYAYSPLKNRKTPLSYSEAVTLKDSMNDIIVQANRLLPKLHSQQGRTTVQQMLDVATKIVGQLRF